MKKQLKLKDKDQSFQPQAAEDKDVHPEKKLQLAKKLKLPEKSAQEKKEEQEREEKEKEAARLKAEQEAEQTRKEEEERKKKEEEEKRKEEEEAEKEKALSQVTTAFLNDLLDEKPRDLDEEVELHRLILEVQQREESFEYIKQRKAAGGGGGARSNNYQMKSIQKGTNFKKNQEPAEKNGKPYVSNYDLKRAPPDELKMALMQKANKWTDKQKSEQDQDQILKKKIIITLNKITPETHDILYAELLQLCMKSQDCTSALAQNIIKKAWEDSNYSKLYAQICRSLSLVNELKFGGPDNIFRKEMMSKIQKTFEGEIKVYTGNTDKKEDELDAEDKADIARIIRRRTKNNFRFIGELFNSQFLNRVIIYNCLFQQLAIFNEQHFQKKVLGHDLSSEDHLDGLLQILEIIGKKFESEISADVLKKQKKCQEQEHVFNIFRGLKDFYSQCKSGGSDLGESGQTEVLSKAKRLCDNDVVYKDKKFLDIEQIFHVLELIRDHGDVSKRMTSLITNLIQKKAENWEERFQRGQGPKKLNQIQQEHARQHDPVDERAERNYNQRSKNYNDSYYSKRYDDKANYEEVLYVAKDQDTSKRKRKQTYDGLLAHEIEERFKEMNRKLDANNTDYMHHGGQPYAGPEYHKDAENLVQESDNIVFMEIYFKLFSDGRKENIRKRLDVLLHLFQGMMIQLSEVVNELSNNMQKLWEISDDYPEMTNAFATIIYQFATQTPFKITSLNLKLNLDDEDLKDMKQWFFICVLEKLVKKYIEAGTAQEQASSLVQLLTDLEHEDPKDWLRRTAKIEL